MIHQQNLIAHFEPEAAIATLDRLVPGETDRQRAQETVAYIVGAVTDMEEGTLNKMNELRAALGGSALVRPDDPPAAKATP